MVNFDNYSGIVVWDHSIRIFNYALFNRFSEKGCKVIYAVEQKEFRNLDIPVVDNNVEIVIITDLKDIVSLTNRTRQYLHINNAYTQWPYLIHKALIYLLKNNFLVISLFQEQYPYWTGVKGILRRLKWCYIFNFSYGKAVKAVGCTGNSSLLAYRKAFVKDEKFFDFIYITECLRKMDISLQENDAIRFVFVGGIVKRKSAIELVDIFKQITNKNIFLSIIGDGDLTNVLVKKISNVNNIFYLGSLSNEQVRQELLKSDVLILPSKFDGWGCVVNEALQCGLRVIVSDACGAHSLIQEKE